MTMQIDATLDYELIAVESEDRVHLMLELAAPASAQERERPPATLQVVLDRSGSMGNGRLLSALQAIDGLLGRLRPDDRFGLVSFDSEVEVPVGAAPLGDPARARAALRRIRPRGMTNLAGGLLRGIQEAQRVAGESGATLVLLSDGHANQGVTDHVRLERFAAGAQGAGISASTIGIGLGYDEDLLASIARGGAGNTHFAEQGDAAGAALASEVDGLLEQRLQAVSLTVRPAEPVAAVRVENDLPATAIEDGFMVELGNLYAGEQRRLLLEVDVPAISALGLAKVCELELRWVDVETMKSEVATLPVSVNVVPGDEAAGRTENPEVRTELAFQQAQRAKREATDALQAGDVDRAVHRYRAASKRLRGLDLSTARPEARDEVDAEAEILERLAEEASFDQMSARKRARADYHRKSRRRRREY